MARCGTSVRQEKAEAAAVPTRAERREDQEKRRLAHARVMKVRSLGFTRMTIPKRTARRSLNVMAEIAKGNYPYAS